MPYRNPMVGAYQRKGLGDPDEAARVAMNADGEMYSAPQRDEMKAAMGMGHLDIGYLNSPANGPQRAGSRSGAQRLGMMARHGVEMGPVWNEVQDLNRGRRATGAAPEYDPVGNMAGAARSGGAMAQNMMMSQLMDGLKRARSGGK